MSIKPGTTYTDPEAAARKATPAEYKAGLDRAIEKGWFYLHESGTFVRLTQPAKDPFA